MRGLRQNFPWTASVVRSLWPEGPARRKRWMKIAVVFAAIVALHAALTVFMAARTADTTDRFIKRWGALDPAAHQPKAVEDADNKARAVHAAAEILALPSPRAGRSRVHEDYASGKLSDLTPADRDEITRVIADNAIAFSLLDLAAARPRANWDLHYERGMETDLPPLLRILQIAKLNVAAGRLALEKGRVDEAIAAVRRGTALAASLDNEPLLIVQLIRLAVGRLDAVLVRRILAGADLTAAQLDALAPAFSDANPRLAVQQALIVETGAIGGAVAGRSDASHSSYSMSPRIANLVTIGIVRVLARPYLLAEERLWLTLASAQLEALDAPRHARAPSDPGASIRWWDVLVRIYSPNEAGLVERADLAEARNLLGRTALAIERHRRETGRAPAALADLVPRELPAVPIDPLTGRPFRYEADGIAWRLHTEADVSSMENARMFDPVLDWSRK